MRTAALLFILASPLGSQGGTCPNGYAACVDVTNKCPGTLYMQRTSVDGDENKPSQVTTVSQGDTVTMDMGPGPIVRSAGIQCIAP